MTFNSKLLYTTLLLGNVVNLNAQDNIYIPPMANVFTHADVQIGVFGDIINDSQGGLNHSDGGKIFLYRDSSIGNGASKIVDGPLSTNPTDNYNSGGSFVRIYDLVTDNTTGIAVPSGSQINTNTGSGHVEIHQELKISHTHLFNHGIIWTPRDQWKHAYLTYENGATYTGVVPNNQAGNHVDGYVAYEGHNDFIFPVGDGISTRMSGIKNPEQGIYKSAYFYTNSLMGTSGISGTSVNNSIYSNGILSVDSTEFWDIDGTGSSQILLTACNTGRNTSKWASNFSNYTINNTSGITIVGWDEWENLGFNKQPIDFFQDDTLISSVSVNPDLGGTNGNPFGAFTWAMALYNSLSIQDLKFNIQDINCKAHIKFVTTNENKTTKAEIMRTDDSNNTFQKIGEVQLERNTTGNTVYTFVDETSEINRSYIYRLDIVHESGDRSSSLPILYSSKCNSEVFWNLYPNPSHGIITLESNSQDPIASIKVYDIIGKLVEIIPVNYKSTTNRFVQQIDLTSYSGSMYYIRVDDPNNNTLKSFEIKLID